MIYAIAGTVVTEHENGAKNFPDGSITVSKVDELKQLKMPALVALYNTASPLNRIKKFTSKAQAQKRVWDVLPQLVELNRGDTLIGLYVAKFAGKKLHIRSKKNPRKAHTHAHVVWEKLKEGMTFEQYIRAGGRVHDLLIDIRKERLELQ